MEKPFYQVIISYPDGHVEQIEETFDTLDAAKSFGVSMINSIKATEAYHAHSDDILLERKLKKPSYEILEVLNHTHKSVFKGK